MKKSFLILLLALLAGSAVAADGYAVRSGSGRQRLECGTEYEIVLPRPEDIPMEEYLRTLDAAVVRLFRVTRSNQAGSCLVRFEADVPVGEPRFDNNRDGVVLHLSNDFAAWRHSRPELKALFAAVVLPAHGLNPADPAVRLPHWIAAGMTGEIEARLAEDRIFRVGYFPGVRGALLSGASPDWAQRFIIDPEMDDAEGPLWDLYVESSRLMLEMAYRFSSARDNVLGDYLVLKARGGKDAAEVFYSTIGRMARGRDHSLDLSAEEAARKGMDDFVRNRVFSKYQPLPGVLALERFRRLRKVECLVMKENGVLEKLEGDLTELADWVPLYPEALLLPGQKIKEINALRSSASLVAGAEFDRLIALLSGIKSSGNSTGKVDLGIAANALEAAFERQRLVEVMLLTGNGAPGVIPSRDRTRWTVLAARLTAPELPPGLAAFLQQAADAYLGR